MKSKIVFSTFILFIIGITSYAFSDEIDYRQLFRTVKSSLNWVEIEGDKAQLIQDNQELANIPKNVLNSFNILAPYTNREKNLRIKADLTQEQLGKKLKPKKVRKETISRLERGKSNYNINLLFQIAEVLECDISDFCFSNKNRPSISMFEGILEDFKQKIIEEEKTKYKK